MMFSASRRDPRLTDAAISRSCRIESERDPFCELSKRKAVIHGLPHSAVFDKPRIRWLWVIRVANSVQLLALRSPLSHSREIGDN